MLSRSPERILVAEASDQHRLAVCETLQNAGYTTFEAVDGAEAMRSLYELRPDLVVLAAWLPVFDGRQVLSRIREISAMPVIMLTDGHTDGEAAYLLVEGADDVIDVSCALPEVAARVEALLRRAHYASQPVEWVVLGDSRLELDLEAHIVRIDGIPVDVTPLDFRLLTTFLKHPDQVLSPVQLLQQAWDDQSPVGPERVKFAVTRLRHKLTSHGLPDPIAAIRGVGYRYQSLVAARCT